MIKKMLKGLIVFSLLGFLLMPLALQAQDDPFGTEGLEFQGLSREMDPKTAAVGIVNIVLGFLGLVGVIVVLIGGFKWMTAGGNEEKVGAAKKLLISGLIGLIIVLLSWGIATWVIDTTMEITAN